MIRSDKLMEHQYMEGYAKCLESKRVEWDECRNVKQIWEQEKRAVVKSAREECASVRVGRKNLKSVWWNEVVKAV